MSADYEIHFSDAPPPIPPYTAHYTKDRAYRGYGGSPVEALDNLMRGRAKGLGLSYQSLAEIDEREAHTKGYVEGFDKGFLRGLLVGQSIANAPRPYPTKEEVQALFAKRMAEAEARDKLLEPYQGKCVLMSFDETKVYDSDPDPVTLFHRGRVNKWPNAVFHDLRSVEQRRASAEKWLAGKRAKEAEEGEKPKGPSPS